jgi:hypothetical protein
MSYEKCGHETGAAKPKMKDVVNVHKQWELLWALNTSAQQLPARHYRKADWEHLFLGSFLQTPERSGRRFAGSEIFERH